MDFLIETVTSAPVILLIGIVTVIGLIIVARLNAFIALITAAIVVSLLSPGAWSEKISRVADAFGSTAAQIGVVIAMAAVIGKCLMDSGAADRIVRSFAKALGEKRAPTALMASGFVLSMPVFFDTVFYLLVPLARSLWKRTQKNYVLYITAIAAGGVITHTLVPPTPGPLVMASTLNIDIGMMILVGALIGLPTAVVAMVVCRLMNRFLDIPMRSYGTEPEPEPLADEELPGLLISLAPVLLPVVLISINTFTKMAADAEHADMARQAVVDGSDAIFDWPGVAATLGQAAKDADAGEQASPTPGRLVQLLPADLRASLVAADEDASADAAGQAELQSALAALAHEGAFSGDKMLKDLALSGRGGKSFNGGPGKRLLDRGAKALSPEEMATLNWYLLEAALPQQVKPTSLSKAADVTALLGDPNLALLLSGIIAMAVLQRKRRLPLKELAKRTEEALMSGGVIILITAGGGAFGGMLRLCGVKESIESLVPQSGGQMTVVMLLLGFAIATVMKIAQGSSTVSMITTSSIMASMGVTAAMLGCHPVYLATAIGGGAMTGSWMNDSGFWIFARMGGLTEVEALKSWSILLASLGVTVLLFTLLAATVFPMV